MKSEVEFKEVADVIWLAGEGNSLAPPLLDILRWLAGWFWGAGKPFVVTSLFRPEGGSGIHSTIPLRAFDCRCTDLSEPVRVGLCTAVNRMWVYDPARPALSVMLCHDAGWGVHFHVQVHPNTRPG